MNVLVVIVNYRTADLTVQCLKSLEPEVRALDGVRVVVTDNASADGSVENITRAIEQHGWSDFATCVALGRNGGYSYGNNAAIAPALKSDDPPRYVYLLNPDTVVLEGAVRELVRFMDENPDVAIAGGRLVNPDMTVRNSVFRFHCVLSELENALRIGAVSRMLKRYVVATTPPDEPAPADWVSGASMMIRREVFDRIGLLDEGYFMYFDETDFCLRAHRAGLSTWYVPGSRVIHLVGQSSGVTGARRNEKRRPRYWFESRRRYFVTHYGYARTFLADVLWTCGYAIGSVLCRLRGRRREDPPWLLWDFVRYNLMPWGQRH